MLTNPEDRLHIGRNTLINSTTHRYQRYSIYLVPFTTLFSSKFINGIMLCLLCVDLLKSFLFVRYHIKITMKFSKLIWILLSESSEKNEKLAYLLHPLTRINLSCHLFVQKRLMTNSVDVYLFKTKFEKLYS